FAAAIGVDRAVEADIGRVVARDDRAGRIDAENRRDPARLFFHSAPAVIEGDPPLALEAAGRVADGAASLARHDAARHIHAGDYAGSMRTIQEHNTVSVVIPTLDAAGDLPATLAALAGVPSVGEIVVAEGGSRDDSIAIAQAAGARIVRAPKGRGTQLAAGAAAVSGDWLLFLHADCSLASGWEAAVAAFVTVPGAAGRAGYFAFALEDQSRAA